MLRYPDEVDPSLWKRSHERDSMSTIRQPKEFRNIDAEKSCEEESEARDIDLQGFGGNVDAGQHRNDTFLVDWYGSDDPENPQNWHSTWKLFVSFQICLLNFSVYMASSIYVSGEFSIMEEFGTGEIVATLGLSLFTVGYGLGPMLWSPMSEIPTLGRNRIYFFTLLIFVLLQLPTGFAVNMPMFLVFRLLSGFFGSPALATGGATLGDMYQPATLSYGICIWGSFGIFGPVFGPILGGYIIMSGRSWRWTIWIIAWLNAFVLAVLFIFLPETSAANILYKRAKRLRQATGEQRFKSQSEIDAANHTWRDSIVVLGRAFKLTFAEPVVFVLDLYTALLYGVLFTWFESFPLVFGDIYHFNLGEQGLAFLSICIGGTITVPLFLIWVRYGIIPRFNSPTFKPEWVLPPTFFGSATLPICLFWYGWSARESVDWIVPVVGAGFFTVSIVTLFFPVLNYLGIAYPEYSASIFAGNALFRASFGAVFPLFARQLFQLLGIGPGNSLLGGLALCFMPLPYIFYKYGEKIRHMSKNARHDV